MEPKARWLTDKYIRIMLLVFPLWTGLDGYARLTVSKFAFFAAATGLWLLALGVCALRARRRPGRPGAPALCALGFMAAACLSALFSPYGARTLLGAGRYDGLLTLLLYGGAFLGVSAWGEAKRAYVGLLAVSAGGCCLVAVLQLAGHNALWLYPEGLGYRDAGLRFSSAFLGTLGNVDVLAAFLCLCIPLFLHTALEARAPRDRWLYLPAALCLAVLLASRVASGAVALFGLLLFGLPWQVFRRTASRRARRAALGCSLGLLLAALALVWSWPGETGTLYELSRVLRGEWEDGFGSSRVRIWREALALFAERPWTGGGPDTLGLRSAIDFSRYVPETGLTLAAHVDNAHNEFLNYLVNLGAPGLAAYLAVLASALRRWLRGAAPAFGAAVCCYLIQSFFGLGLCLVVPLLWIFLGLVCAGVPPPAAPTGDNPMDRREPPCQNSPTSP